jgi:hypothetical protein
LKSGAEVVEAANKGHHAIVVIEAARVLAAAIQKQQLIPNLVVYTLFQLALQVQTATGEQSILDAVTELPEERHL